MDIRELTELLVESGKNSNRAVYIPWWEDDHENQIYRCHVLEAETVENAESCLAECGKEQLFAPVNRYGITLFQMLVWHNFYHAVEGMLGDGRVEGDEINLPDQKGRGITAFMLACVCGNLAMAKLLLEHGADASLCDRRGRNAYHFLACPRLEELELSFTCLERSVEQRSEIAHMLSCDINRKNEEGLAPLEALLSSSHRAGYTWPLPEIFLKKGASVDYVDADGNTLLMLALKNGHSTAALKLMDQCPEQISVANSQGVTPIMHAVSFCDNAMYIALTDHGAEKIPYDYIRAFPLSQITSNTFCDVRSDNRDRLSLALYLAEKLIRQLDTDDDDELGEITDILHNALIADKEYHVLEVIQEAGIDFLAAIHYHGEEFCLRDKCLGIGFGAGVVKKLLKLGVDMDSAVVRGETPANILAMKDRQRDSRDEAFFAEAARLFSGESMGQLNNNGEAAIHRAAKYGHAGMIKVMIEKGVDVNLTQDRPAEAGVTPLHLACSYGHADVVRLLIDAGADDTLQNLNGETPAHFALMKKKYGEALRTEQRAALLKELTHLDLPREDGQTPLMLLQRFDRELLSVFLDRGVDVNHADNRGRTAMMLLSDKDMLKELIRAGADIHMADREGNTVLHYVLKNGDGETARYLIKKGADYNRPNNSGETPAQLAVERGLETVLELMTDIK